MLRPGANRGLCGPLLGLLVVPSLSVCSVSAARGQEPPYEIVTRKNVMVPLRDGVKLATDIYLPGRNGAAVEGRLPVVLSRTPYGKAGMAGTAKYYAPRGYVVIGQDTRGRGDSEGVWHWMTDDRQDGYDAIEWIAGPSRRSITASAGSSTAALSGCGSGTGTWPMQRREAVRHAILP